MIANLKVGTRIVFTNGDVAVTTTSGIFEQYGAQIREGVVYSSGYAGNFSGETLWEPKNITYDAKFQEPNGDMK